MGKPTPRRTCPNCHYPIPDYGRFCTSCGQKYNYGRITFWQLVQEFVDTVFNLDNRLFKTLGALFVPGKLTREYFEGRQRRFASPIRMFLISAVILFAAFGFVALPEIEEGLSEFTETNTENAYHAVFFERLQARRDTVAQTFAASPEARSALDTLVEKMREQHRDSMNIFYIKHERGLSFTSSSWSLSLRDMYTVPTDSLLDRYHINGVVERLTARQVLKANTRGDGLASAVLGKMIWMMVLLMPALALILKLLYVRRRRYYVEHLIFSFHYHAFAFLVLSVMLLLINANDGNDGGIVGWTLLIVFGYLLLAMRRVYRQGWLKTFFKFMILNVAYAFIASIFFALTFVVSALTF